ncbi:HET-domain-containing protein, partial [Lojkania enalia]
YAALSHCWGPESNIMKATTNNLKDLHMEIDESALSKSFRDAIKTTRILHIKYLWIDALCVVQDDVSDWHKEASQMGEYYKNAVLTLSALSAPNGDVGFLIPRRHECVQLEAGWGIRNASRPWEEVFENSPLSRRAWALQERLLSTRVLHFGNDEIFWECLSFSARESNYALKKEYPMSLETFEIIFQRSLPESGSRIRCRDAMRSWYEIVCKYSGLELTVQSDIFPGIAGIAQRFQQTTDFHYMAGLWLEHALCGLLWHADCVTEHKRLQEVPTWSWASLSGRV